MPFLSFSVVNNSLLIHGMSFYVKNELEALGGTWNPLLKAWRIPLLHDSKGFRMYLVEKATHNRKLLLTKYIFCESCEKMGDSTNSTMCNSCLFK